MENNQPANKIDAISQFLTVHNTTIIAIIMAISGLLGQHYQEQREEVYDDVEDIEDILQGGMDTSETADFEMEMGNLSEDYGLDESYSAENPPSKEKLESLKDAMDTKENLSGYASTILQISVLLSSVGMTNKARMLTYLASFATLIGVVIEIITAVM